ncbi:MAG: tetratricopeptide repeat protein, partial [Planctomycetota bacterium]
LALGLWIGFGRGVPVRDVPALPDTQRVDLEVRALFEQVRARVQRSPGDAEAWAALAMASHANGLGRIADGCYEQALALDGSNARWWYLRSSLRAGRGDADAALDDITRAIDRDTSHAASYWRRGFLHLDAGRIDDATADFENALRLDPRDPAAAAGLARVELIRGDARAAAARLEALLAAHPRDAYAPYLHGLLASAYRQLGAAGRAGRHAGLTDGERPIWPDTWAEEVARFRRGYEVTVQRAEALAAAGRVPEAIDLLRGLLNRYPHDPVALNELQALYAQTGRVDEAIRLLEGVVTSDPGHAASHLNLAIHYTVAGNHVKAMRHVDAALAANPSFGPAFLQKGRLHALAGENEPAASALEQAFRYGVEDATARIMLGRLLIALGRYDAASQSFEAVLLRYPDDVSAWTGLAAALAEIGPVEQAAQAVARARQLGPTTDYDRNMLRNTENRLRGREGPSP